MSRPQRRNNKAQIYRLQAYQALVWVVLTALALMFELAYVGKVGVITVSVCCGSLLHFVAQSVFTLIAYRLTGANVRQQIMLNMYLGQMIKWLIVLVGFALIFVWIKPILAWLVFISYLVMQSCHSISMWRVQ